MAGVLIATQSWGVLWQRHSSASQELQVPDAGQLASITATVFTDSGLTVPLDPALFVSNADGELPGYVADGAYAMTVAGVTKSVEASSGTAGTRADAAASAAAGASSGAAAAALAISDHLADATDAHDASAVSVVPAGSLTQSNAQAALQGLAVRSDSLESRHVQDEGSDLAARGKINFVGTGVTATDDAPGDRTVVTIAAGGHVVEDEGTPLSQRANLNFTGAGVTAADAGGKTVVTIPGSSGGGITVDARGNLGASQTIDLSASSTDIVEVTGTLNANCTITLSNRRKCIVALLLTQDATGGRTLTLSDGVGSTVVAVPATALAATKVDLSLPDATSIYIDTLGGLQGPTGPPSTVPGPTGPAGLTWQGAWVSGTTYAVNDAVSDAGASYRRLIAGAGTTAPLTDTTNWAVLAAKGATGTNGSNGTNGTNAILASFQDEGVAVTARTTLDVQGSGAALTEDGSKLILTVPGGGIPATLVDAKGDLLTGTADNTVARKAVGADGTIFIADSTQTDGLLWAGPMRQRVASGMYLIAPHSGITTTAQPAGFMGATLLFVPARQTFDWLTLNVTTLQPGFCRLGIYADSGGKPGALILDCGTVACSAIAPVHATISQSLPPGAVWCAVLCEQTGGGNVGFSASNGIAINNHTTISFPGATNPDSLYYRSGVATGAMPNPFGAVSGQQATAAPIMGLRAV